MPHPITQLSNVVAASKARRILTVKLLLALWLSLTASHLVAEQLTIAVASNFAIPMREIGRAFEQESDHKVRFAFGSSGKLAAQILQGAPFAAFFSADQHKPALLTEKGVVTEGSQFTYAIGRLALWSSDSGIDPLAQLKNGHYRKLALANPKLAPYGEAAVEVLESLGMAQTSAPKWVQGENIAQTYQFVESGNAELGFVAYSQIYTGGQLIKGAAWLIPDKLHRVIRQDAVLLGTKQSVAARQFMHFMRGAKVRAIMEGYGYQTDSEKSSETAQ